MHKPVLLNEAIKFLEPKSGDIILDATIDGGGHAIEIFKKILPGGKLIGIDQDKQLLDAFKSQISISNFQTNFRPRRIRLWRTKFKIQNSKLQKNMILVNENFRNVDKILESLKIKKLDGALYDLGMSSAQLEESGRGFTFQKDEPLLMTYKFPLEMRDLTAGKILNTWPEKDISEILFRYGEERFARRIAKNIIEKRKKHPLKSTFDLVEIIMKSVPFRHYRKIHPATKTFQALRIAVNDELNALKDGLEKVWEFFIPGSRLVVLSFHSLEDRIVKNFLKDKKREGAAEIKTKKPVIPSEEEMALNPRSRSAKLRAAVKVFRQRRISLGLKN
jgi:16S rRNA (cytosine1402-N4)-methyltransferase